DAEQERRRHREVAVTGLPGRADVGVARIGLAGGPGEGPEPAAGHQQGLSRGLLADDRPVQGHQAATRSYRVTTQAPPSPRLCCNATRAPSTWRGPACPRSCQTSSAHWARPVAPSGWPLDSRPPEGLVTTHPPSVWLPSRLTFSAVPSGVGPSASWLSSSLVVKQSCSSATGMSSGPIP